jgi:hypothetical protein
MPIAVRWALEQRTFKNRNQLFVAEISKFPFKIVRIKIRSRFWKPAIRAVGGAISSRDGNFMCRNVQFETFPPTATSNRFS